MENKYILSVIVPFHNTPSDTLATIASSISIQQGIAGKIEMIFIEDGPSRIDGVLTKIELKNFIASKEVRSHSSLYTLEENVGPGLARQAGLDKARGKYVTFCDADDLLYDAFTLARMVSAMEDEELDYLSTDWIEEIGDNEYMRHGQEISWLHGKILRRSFLIDNKIKFHPDLRVHEDTYFASVCIDTTDNPRHLSKISYVWTNNKNSITRKEDILTYEVRNMPVFIKTNCEAIRFLYDKCKFAEAISKTYTILHFVYLLQFIDRWQDPVNREQIPESMESLYENIPLYTLVCIKDISDSAKQQIIDSSCRVHSIDVEKVGITMESFEEWIKEVHTKVSEREGT